MVTLDGTLPVKLRAQHPHPKNQHGKWEDNPDAEADTPDSLKMILSSDRKNDEKDRTSQGTPKLVGISATVE